jgi:hypothetical protein
MVPPKGRSGAGNCSPSIDRVALGEPSGGAACSASAGAERATIRVVAATEERIALRQDRPVMHIMINPLLRVMVFCVDVAARILMIVRLASAA